MKLRYEPIVVFDYTDLLPDRMGLLRLIEAQYKMNLYGTRNLMHRVRSVDIDTEIGF